MTTPLLLHKTGKPLLIKSFFVSALAHIVLLSYLYFNPLALQSPLESLFGMTLAQPKQLPHHSDVDVLNKNLTLEEVFNTILVAPSKLHPPYDFEELPQGLALAPQEEIAPKQPLQTPALSSFHALIDKNTLDQEIILKEMEEKLPSPLFQALEDKAKVASHLQIDEPIASIELPFSEPIEDIAYEESITLAAPSEESPIAYEEKPLLFSQDKAIFFEEHEAIADHLSQEYNLSLTIPEKKPALFVPKSPALSASLQPARIPETISHLDTYTFPKFPPSALWNEDFSIDVNIAPHPERNGYLFAVTLTPTKDLSSHRLKQNFYFLLDRSSSSQKRRFPVFKRATLKALASMQPEDGFNIFVLDKQVTAFRSEAVAASLKNKRSAEEFLEAQESSLLFQNGSVYSTLKQILPLIPDNEEMHTAILLTDGQNSMDARKKQQMFNRWIDANQGKVTLYTAAVGKDNDLLSLDLLSTESGGRLLYSDTHASFPRKLAKLILDLKHPLAKQVEVSCKPYQPRSYIELYPDSYLLPSLYANESYVICGEIDRLEPFDLIIEGRHRQDWIGIKKKVTFDHALPADSHLIKQWKKAQASVYYTRFLSEGKQTHLKEAKDILNHSQKEISFQ